MTQKKETIRISNVDWIWCPPIVCYLTITVPPLFHIHRWSIQHWIGNDFYRLISPSQVEKAGKGLSHAPIVEFVHPDLQIRFTERVGKMIADEFNIILDDQKEMDYLWSKYAEGFRLNETVRSKYGIKTIPEYLRTRRNRSR